jgi:RNA polymerase sigma-70 factor, ECF subfamily
VDVALNFMVRFAPLDKPGCKVTRRAVSPLQLLIPDRDGNPGRVPNPSRDAALPAVPAGSARDRDPREASPAEAIDNLYEQHAQVVAGWIYGLMGPSADIEDLVHDTFLVAHRRRREFRGEASAKTWLFGIMANVVANRRKTERVRRWLFARFVKEDEARAASPVVPIEEVIRRERVARLYRALDRLPDIYRTALILFEIEGIPGNEIALLMGIDIETLWVRLHRGRAKLQALMSKEDRP